MIGQAGGFGVLMMLARYSVRSLSVFIEQRHHEGRLHSLVIQRYHRNSLTGSSINPNVNFMGQYTPLLRVC